MSKVFSALVVGDMHLLRNIHLIPDADKKRLKILKHVYKHAVQNNIRHIVMLGDNFHVHNPPQQLLVELKTLLSKCNKATWHFLIGNHEENSTINTQEHALQTLKFASENGLNNVKVYDTVTFSDIDGVKCGFFRYPFYQVPKSHPPCLCFGHFDAKGIKYESGSKSRSGVDMSTDLRKRDFWFVGHIHLYQQKSRVVYTGVPIQGKFDDSYPCSVSKVTASMEDDKLVVEHSRVPMPPLYRMVTLKIDNIKDLKIPDDPTIYYKLMGVKPPQDLLLKYPNIIAIAAVPTTKEKVGAIQSVSTVNVVDLVKSSIQSKKWKRPKRKRVMRLVNQAILECKASE